MKPLYPDALTKLLSGNAMYAELSPSRPDLRKWVCIFRFREPNGAWRYGVQGFEIKAEYVEKEYDAAGTEENKFRHVVDSLEEALEILATVVPGIVEWVPESETECPL